VNHKYKADVTDSVSIITGSRIMAEYHMHNKNSTKNNFQNDSAANYYSYLLRSFTL